MKEVNYTNLEIAQLAQNLQVGEQIGGEICPECGGGGHKEQSFSLTRSEDGILYLCHRASCGFRGYVPTDPAGPVVRRKVKPPRPYEGPLVPLPEDYVRHFKKMYELDADELEYRRVLYAPDDEAVYFTCRSVFGRDLGGLTRVYFGPHKKRIRTYRATPDPIYAHYPCRDKSVSSSTCYLVEDCVSAIKIANFCGAVALLGTNLPMAVVYDLRLRYKKIVVALDPDMRAKSLKIKRDIQLFFDMSSVHFFERDPKDTPLEELGNEIAQD